MFVNIYLESFSLQGFYLGNRIKVITKREECPYVTEISISKVMTKVSVDTQTKMEGF